MENKEFAEAELEGLLPKEEYDVRVSSIVVFNNKDGYIAVDKK